MKDRRTGLLDIRPERARPEKQEIIKVSAARKNGHVVDSSDDSFSDDEIDADEEASSRESSRRPMIRKSFENKFLGKESLVGRNSSKQPSCSPQDSDTGDSEERITISQKNGYISVYAHCPLTKKLR